MAATDASATRAASSAAVGVIGKHASIGGTLQIPAAKAMIGGISAIPTPTKIRALVAPLKIRKRITS
ncbi:MAG: hypothetical protein QXE89_13245 [Pyrobaculum sp.]